MYGICKASTGRDLWLVLAVIAAALAQGPVVAQNTAGWVGGR